MMQTFRTEGNYVTHPVSASQSCALPPPAARSCRPPPWPSTPAASCGSTWGACGGVMPFAACAEGADTGAVRDIAVLTRVGRATCFVIESLDEDAEGRAPVPPVPARAQQMCREEYQHAI